ncbi:cadherin-12-like [Stigmatopora nigra]
MIRWEHIAVFLLCSCFLLDGAPADRRCPRPRWRKKGGARHAPRIKRGWVWNQFFVLEEYTGSEAQYVGKLHTEMDRGDRQVRYSLSGEGAGSIFTIHPITGDMHVLVGLDREEKSEYTLKAQAKDVATGLPLEPESEFVIKVQDVNDNQPRFPHEAYMAVVPEMAPAGTFVTQVTATDADDPAYGKSAQVVYALLRGHTHFFIERKSGVIRTAVANLDRETEDQYLVVVQATDMGGQLGGLVATVVVNVTLGDVNDNPPRFAKNIFHLAVGETAAVGSVVGRIWADDPDAGQNARVAFSVLPGEEADMFDVVSEGKGQEGVVVLKKCPDFESKKSHVFRVQASNPHVDPRFLHLGPFRDWATVRVEVVDAEEPPVFTPNFYWVDAYEDTPSGSVIGSVTAHDLDAGSSAVRYSLEWRGDSDSFFDIDTIDGTILLNDVLDREERSQHNISVLAVKVLNPLLSAKVWVTVNVLDVNEFPPKLEFQSDTLVCETSQAGKVIQMVSAVDLDLPAISPRFFFKTPKDLHKRMFNVRDYGNNTAGIVTRRSGIQRGLPDFYVLPVVVEDSGYPVRSSTSTLTFRVCLCGTDGSSLACSARGVLLAAGLGAGSVFVVVVVGVLLCVLLFFVVERRRRRRGETASTSKDDIRDNVVHYDDEGGGEEDTGAFDMGALCDTGPERAPTDSLFKSKYGHGVLLHLRNGDHRVKTPDIHRQTAGAISSPPLVRLGTTAAKREVAGERARSAYDSEGHGSLASSLCSLAQSWAVDDLGDLSSLGDWGRSFKSLVGIFGRPTEEG